MAIFRRGLETRAVFMSFRRPFGPHPILNLLGKRQRGSHLHRGIGVGCRRKTLDQILNVRISSPSCPPRDEFLISITAIKPLGAIQATR